MKSTGALLAIALAAALGLSACGSSASHKPSASATASTVKIALTPSGCAPKPAHVPAGEVEVSVENKDAGAVSEAELRTSDLAHILGEQENLTPGLSGGFALELQPGHYVINCPGASKQHWSFTVSGKSSGPSWSSNHELVSAVESYRGYVDENAASLVNSSEAFCRQIDAGSLQGAKLAYPKARVYYERIEPVAEIWGALDTEIDGRWENPVTVRSQFVGFHRIEQQLWEKGTLAGTSSLCAELVKHEQQLQTLVHSATYNPLEMAGGATDLVNEASTSKVTGEEERYSNTDLPVLQANIDGAKEVVSLLGPFLQGKDPALLKQLEERYAKATKTVDGFKESPGYDGTGYVEYSTVLDSSRRRLSGVLNAYAESLSQLSTQVS
ncbi:MAG TPA: iron uptake system protein EfeO [Solirubrobacteraceae bacterium]|jgi:iron uptake system component EfeO